MLAMALLIVPTTFASQAPGMWGAVIIVGVMMLIAGAAEIIAAFSVKTWGKFLLWMLLGALYIFAGAVCIQNPFAAATDPVLIPAITAPPADQTDIVAVLAQVFNSQSDADVVINDRFVNIVCL